MGFLSSTYFATERIQVFLSISQTDSFLFFAYLEGPLFLEPIYEISVPCNLEFRAVLDHTFYSHDT